MNIYLQAEGEHSRVWRNRTGALVTVTLRAEGDLRQRAGLVERDDLRGEEQQKGSVNSPRRRKALTWSSPG